MQALINAHNNRKYESIKKAVSGLAFFATPHSGRDKIPESLGNLAAKIAINAGFRRDDRILKVLESGSMFADIMQENWQRRLLEYDIVSFWGSRDSVSRTIYDTIAPF